MLLHLFEMGLGLWPKSILQGLTGGQLTVNNSSFFLPVLQEILSVERQCWCQPRMQGSNPDFKIYIVCLVICRWKWHLNTLNTTSEAPCEAMAIRGESTSRMSAVFLISHMTWGRWHDGVETPHHQHLCESEITGMFNKIFFFYFSSRSSKRLWNQRSSKAHFTLSRMRSHENGKLTC